MFEAIRRDRREDPEVSIRELAVRHGVHRRTVRQALASAEPPPSQLAEQRGLSLSAMISELTVRGLAQLDTPLSVARDEVTGLPVISLGRSITAAEVADLIDEER